MYHNEEARAFISRIPSLPSGLVSLDTALRASLKDEAALRELFATDETRASTPASTVLARLPQAYGSDPAGLSPSPLWRVRQHVEHRQATAERLLPCASAGTLHVEVPRLRRAFATLHGDLLLVQVKTLAAPCTSLQIPQRRCRSATVSLGLELPDGVPIATHSAAPRGS